MCTFIFQARDSVWAKKKICCISDDVSEGTRFTFTLPRVDRWSERLAFTHMTQVVTKHLLKCHRARRWLPTSSRLLFCSRACPLTPLCQRRWASLWDQHRMVLFILRCKLHMYHHHGWVSSPCTSHGKDRHYNLFFNCDIFPGITIANQVIRTSGKWICLVLISY